MTQWQSPEDDGAAGAAADSGARGWARKVAAAGARALRGGGTAARQTVVTTLGGPERTRVVLVMAFVLALASADTATVGAAAIELRRALHISNTDIGILVSVTSLVAAVFSLPFGMLADRVRRTWLLGGALLVWGAAMFWSAMASSFGELLTTRLLLGAITAAAGPVTASLTGDWFAAGERGKIYGYILTGELLGSGVGFAFTGDIAALSWRAAFIILALPAFVLAWLVIRLPEPVRGGQGALAAVPGTQRRTPAAPPPQEEPAQPQELATAMGIEPDEDLARQANAPMGFLATMRYILSVRTNIALIVSGACGYYFLAGLQTFGTEFVAGQYGISQAVSNLLLLVVGGGAVAGVIASGPISDMLLRRGHLTSRVTVAAVSASATVLLFIPALITHDVLAALPYVIFAAAALSAQNPPIDAARLDIMPSWLWGRSEGLRTLLRTAAQSLAPLLFGAFADYVFGGGVSGLRWTFVIMLIPLAASAGYLFQARRRYPRDVATAAVAEADRQEAEPGWDPVTWTAPGL